MALAGSLVLSVQVQTDSVESGMKKMRVSLQVTEQQVAALTGAMSTLARSVDSAVQSSTTGTNTMATNMSRVGQAAKAAGADADNLYASLSRAGKAMAALQASGSGTGVTANLRSLDAAAKAVESRSQQISLGALPGKVAVQAIGEGTALGRQASTAVATELAAVSRGLSPVLTGTRSAVQVTKQEFAGLAPLLKDSSGALSGLGQSLHVVQQGLLDAYSAGKLTNDQFTSSIAATNNSRVALGQLGDSLRLVQQGYDLIASGRINDTIKGTELIRQGMLGATNATRDFHDGLSKVATGPLNEATKSAETLYGALARLGASMGAFSATGGGPQSSIRQLELAAKAMESRITQASLRPLTGKESLQAIGEGASFGRQGAGAFQAELTSASQALAPVTDISRLRNAVTVQTDFARVLPILGQSTTALAALTQSLELTKRGFMDAGAAGVLTGAQLRQGNDAIRASQVALTQLRGALDMVAQGYTQVGQPGWQNLLEGSQKIKLGLENAQAASQNFQASLGKVSALPLTETAKVADTLYSALVKAGASMQALQASSAPGGALASLQALQDGAKALEERLQQLSRGPLSGPDALRAIRESTAFGQQGATAFQSGLSAASTAITPSLTGFKALGLSQQDLAGLTPIIQQSQQALAGLSTSLQVTRQAFFDALTAGKLTQQQFQDGISATNAARDAMANLRAALAQIQQGYALVGQGGASNVAAGIRQIQAGMAGANAATAQFSAGMQQAQGVLGQVKEASDATGKSFRESAQSTGRFLLQVAGFYSVVTLSLIHI